MKDSRPIFTRCQSNCICSDGSSFYHTNLCPSRCTRFDFSNQQKWSHEWPREEKQLFLFALSQSFPGPMTLHVPQFGGQRLFWSSAGYQGPTISPWYPSHWEKKQEKNHIRKNHQTIREKKNSFVALKRQSIPKMSNATILPDFSFKNNPNSPCGYSQVENVFTIKHKNNFEFQVLKNLACEHWPSFSSWQC